MRLALDLPGLAAVVLGGLFFGGFAYMAQPVLGWARAWRFCCALACLAIAVVWANAHASLL